MAKLMFIHHSGLIGGAGVSLINTIKTVAKDNEVVVFVPSQPEDMYQLLEKMGDQYHIKVVKYGRRIGAITYYSGGDKILSPRFWYRFFLILFQWRYWNNIIEKYCPDKVIVNSKILCWMGCLRSIKKRRGICFVRETMKGKNTNLVNRLIASFLDKFSNVIFLSNFDLKKEQLERADTRVIHNYVEELQFCTSISRKEASKRLNLMEDSFHVLYVGGVSSMKGFDLCVQSVLDLSENVELIVAGSTFEDIKMSKSKEIAKYAETWERFIQDKDLHHQIHMVGKQKDMSLCYTACDVLVFPMRSPHQSRPAFEAGYFGKPVIITDFECISEFVRDGENGFKIPCNDVKALSNKVKMLYEDKELSEKMGLANLHNTRMIHNFEINCTKIKLVLEE